VRRDKTAGSWSLVRGVRRFGFSRLPFSPPSAGTEATRAGERESPICLLRCAGPLGACGNCSRAVGAGAWRLLALSPGVGWAHRCLVSEAELALVCSSLNKEAALTEEMMRTNCILFLGSFALLHPFPPVPHGVQHSSFSPCSPDCCGGWG